MVWVGHWLRPHIGHAGAPFAIKAGISPVLRALISDRRYRDLSEFFEDGFGGRCPYERPTIVAVGVDVAVDRILQVSDGYEGSAAYSAARDGGEECPPRLDRRLHRGQELGGNSPAASIATTNARAPNQLEAHRDGQGRARDFCVRLCPSRVGQVHGPSLREDGHLQAALAKPRSTKSRAFALATETATARTTYSTPFATASRWRSGIAKASDNRAKCPR